MTGTIFNIQRFSVHDGPGARTTVFFKGCNLHCVWCHNPESIPMQPVVEFYPQKCIGCGACFQACPQGAHITAETHRIDRALCTGCLTCTDTCYAGALAPVGREVTVDYLMKQILTDRLYYENSGGGVTFSGGECMLQIDFLDALLRECKQAGLHTAVDTAGNVPADFFRRILDTTDLFLYDIKAIDPLLHRACTGVTNERVLDNLRFLLDSGKRVFVRIPYIPSKNGRDLPAIADWLGQLPVKPERVEVMPFHKLGAAKYTALDLDDACRDEIPPTDEEVDGILDRLRQNGLDARKS